MRQRLTERQSNPLFRHPGVPPDFPQRKLCVRPALKLRNGTRKETLVFNWLLRLCVTEEIPGLTWPLRMPCSVGGVARRPFSMGLPKLAPPRNWNYGAPGARSSASLRIIYLCSAMDRSSGLPETLPVVLV